MLHQNIQCEQKVLAGHSARPHCHIGCGVQFGPATSRTHQTATELQAWKQFVQNTVVAPPKALRAAQASHPALFNTLAVLIGGLVTFAAVAVARTIVRWASGNDPADSATSGNPVQRLLKSIVQKLLKLVGVDVEADQVALQSHREQIAQLRLAAQEQTDELLRARAVRTSILLHPPPVPVRVAPCSTSGTADSHAGSSALRISACSSLAPSTPVPSRLRPQAGGRGRPQR